MRRTFERHLSVLKYLISNKQKIPVRRKITVFFQLNFIASSTNILSLHQNLSNSESSKKKREKTTDFICFVKCDYKVLPPCPCHCVFRERPVAYVFPSISLESQPLCPSTWKRKMGWSLV